MAGLQVLGNRIPVNVSKETIAAMTVRIASSDSAPNRTIRSSPNIRSYLPTARLIRGSIASGKQKLPSRRKSRLAPISSAQATGRIQALPQSIQRRLLEARSCAAPRGKLKTSIFTTLPLQPQAA
jgi:hypothetical protein